MTEEKPDPGLSKLLVFHRDGRGSAGGRGFSGRSSDASVSSVSARALTAHHRIYAFGLTFLHMESDFLPCEENVWARMSGVFSRKY